MFLGITVSPKAQQVCQLRQWLWVTRWLVHSTSIPSATLPSDRHACLLEASSKYRTLPSSSRGSTLTQVTLNLLTLLLHAAVVPCECRCSEQDSPPSYIACTPSCRACYFPSMHHLSVEDQYNSKTMTMRVVQMKRLPPDHHVPFPPSCTLSPGQ